MTGNQEHKLLKSLEDMAKSVGRAVAGIDTLVKVLERVADGIDKPGEPLIAELDSFAAPMVLSWQDAVRVLKDTCIEAPECGPDCIMWDWCKENIPPFFAPHGWTDPGASE